MLLLSRATCKLRLNFALHFAGLHMDIWSFEEYCTRLGFAHSCFTWENQHCALNVPVKQVSDSLATNTHRAVISTQQQRLCGIQWVMLDGQQCPPPFMFAHQQFPSHIQTLVQTLVFSADACTITYCTCMSVHIKKKKATPLVFWLLAAFMYLQAKASVLTQPFGLLPFGFLWGSTKQCLWHFFFCFLLSLSSQLWLESTQCNKTFNNLLNCVLDRCRREFCGLPLHCAALRLQAELCKQSVYDSEVTLF